MVSLRALCLGVLIPVFAFPSQSAAKAPSPATRAFLDADPGRRAALAGDRLGALYGKVLASDSDSNTTTEQFVAASWRITAVRWA